VKLFSVASFSANQGTGRAFDLEEGRSIPLRLKPDTDGLTVDTLLSSVSSYTKKRRPGDDHLRSAIAIIYACVRAVDGREKSITIDRARSAISQLGI